MAATADAADAAAAAATATATAAVCRGQQGEPWCSAAADGAGLPATTAAPGNAAAAADAQHVGSAVGEEEAVLQAGGVGAWQREGTRTTVDSAVVVGGPWERGWVAGVQHSAVAGCSGMVGAPCTGVVSSSARGACACACAWLAKRGPSLLPGS